MTEELTRFLKGFYKSLLAITENGELRFSNFVDAVHNGNISFISVNTIVKSNEDDTILKSIEDHMDNLWEINRRPRKYLRTEELIRPVQLSKNINTRTIYELSKNSAHWRRIKIDGVEPAKLLTELNDDDYEIYENRIYKTLLDKVASALDMILMKYEQLRENVINANTINDNLTRNHKSARLFRKLAPKELDSLNNISISIIEEKIKQIKDFNGKISYLRSSGLYQKLQRTRDVVSPLNKTNILLQERNYKGMVELWNDMEKYTITLVEGASEDGEIIEVSNFHYSIYVYLFGLLVLKEIGYVIENENLGNILSANFKYRGRTELDQISYDFNKSQIEIDFCEIKNYEVLVPDYLANFFEGVILEKDVEFIKLKLKFNNLVNHSFLDSLKKDYKDYLYKISKKEDKSKTKRFRVEIVDQASAFLRNSFNNKTIIIKTDVSDISPNNAALLSYSSELLKDLFNLHKQNCDTAFNYIIPRLPLSLDFEIKESILNRFYNIGDNYRHDFDKDYIDVLGNYNGGIITVSYDNLVSLTRFQKMLNVHRYSLDTVYDTLKSECPVCGEKIISTNNSDYSCAKCESVWSKSKCTSCNNVLLYVRENNKLLLPKKEKESLIEYYDRIDLERGAMAFTSGVFEGKKFKTLCSNCGKVMG